MRHAPWFAALLVSLATTVAAQTSTPAPITEVQVLILPATGDPLTLAPVSTQNITIGPTANCGLDPASVPPVPAGTTVVNPLLFSVDDPYTTGKKCRLSFPTGLAPGSYQWAGVFRAATCNPTGSQVVSPCPGPRSVGQPPFSVVNRVAPPAAPTGLAFTP